MVRHGEGCMGSAMRHPSKIRHMMMTTITQPIPDRPSPGLQRAASSAVYQGGGGKCATDIYRTTRSVPGATSLWAHGT